MQGQIVCHISINGMILILFLNSIRMPCLTVPRLWLSFNSGEFCLWFEYNLWYLFILNRHEKNSVFWKLKLSQIKKTGSRRLIPSPILMPHYYNWNSSDTSPTSVTASILKIECWVRFRCTSSPQYLLHFISSILIPRRLVTRS